MTSILKRVFFTVIIILGFLLSIPATLIFYKNPKPFIEPLAIFQDYTWHGFINEANTLRGQVDQKKIPLLGKLTASNTETAFYVYLDSALTTLDTHFLFFEGDINPGRSTKNTGALFFIFLPLAYLGLRSLSDKNRIIILGLFIIGFLVAGLWRDVYFITPRLPVLMIVIFLGLKGWRHWYFSLIYIWQFISNIHYLFKHYLI